MQSPLFSSISSQGADVQEDSDVALAESPAGVEAPPEHQRRVKAEQPQKPKRQPRYNVVLWDDDHHTFSYVVLMMLKLFGHPPEKGMQIAKEVDSQGRAVVLTTTREHAELKRDQIHAFGKDDLIDGCKGSMWSTIEPIE